MKQVLEIYIIERMHNKKYNVEGLKTYIGTTLLSQHDIFSKSIPKLIKL
jgi:hypothetical protein